MAIEPLSNTTKKAKISLLTFSLAFLLVNVFNVKMTALPAIGFQFEFSEYLLPWFLVIGMVYNLANFIVFCKDDLNNPIKRHYQINYDRGIKDYSTKVLRFVGDVLKGNKWSESDHVKFVELMKEIAVKYATKSSTEEPNLDNIVWQVQDQLSQQEKRRLFDSRYLEHIKDFISENGEEYYNVVLNKEPKMDLQIANFRKFLDFTFPILFFILSLCSVLIDPIKRLFE